jgi:hypothetical protein
MKAKDLQNMCVRLHLLTNLTSTDPSRHIKPLEEVKDGSLLR